MGQEFGARGGVRDPSDLLLIERIGNGEVPLVFVFAVAVIELVARAL